MKNLIVAGAFALAFAATAPAMAQGKMTPTQRSEQQMKKLDQRLNLTDEQEVSVKSTILRLDVLRDELRELSKKRADVNKGRKERNADGKDAAMMEPTPRERELKAEIVNQNRRLRDVLTPEQRTTYDQMRAEARKRVMDNRKAKRQSSTEDEMMTDDE